MILTSITRNNTFKFTPQNRKFRNSARKSNANEKEIFVEM